MINRIPPSCLTGSQRANCPSRKGLLRIKLNVSVRESTCIDLLYAQSVYLCSNTRHVLCNIITHDYIPNDSLCFMYWLYGCVRPVTLREECRLRVFENRVLRRIFGPKRDEVTGEWRRLHN
jgi:hypothetical protein